MPPIENELIEYYDNSVDDKIYEDFPYEDTTLGNLKYKNSLRKGKVLHGYKEGLVTKQNRNMKATIFQKINYKNFKIKLE
nr:hypothetical protein [uncultured Flavobacterium sp.]